MPSSRCSDDWDSYSDYGSDTSSEDEDIRDCRVIPVWDRYRCFFERCGYHLDTCRDVKQFYLRYWASRNIPGPLKDSLGYSLAMRGAENELCKDAGLPERLFRGTRISDESPIVVKAVHRRSRELEVIRLLSTRPLKDCEMNHCIPVFDLLEPPEDDIAFIVMQEWSSQLISDTYNPCSIPKFLEALRQCIEHVVFMHSHNIAHLDISLRNVVTDYEQHYAYIDYECSRWFTPHNSSPSPRIIHSRAAEVPPEGERMEPTDPYKADVWALGALIRSASQESGFHVKEVLELTNSMMAPCFEQRPTAAQVLKEFLCLQRTVTSSET